MKNSLKLWHIKEYVRAQELVSVTKFHLIVYDTVYREIYAPFYFRPFCCCCQQANLEFDEFQ